ncbi:MAG: ACP S-malonyltransferase [Pseudomonadota bacterium]|nr:[acyl-carrier-protein] S-malonyltransferase [Pseudomonadota bacterium]QKK05951.1 MAG: ACP S-malonyltransferase [Pseudomonadota bacterium]
MTRAFVFPGQGSQFPGMGKELFENFVTAREVFEEVDEALEQNLSKLIFTGEESDLNLTENTQPALMAVSIAVQRILEKDMGVVLGDDKNTAFVAGHSLGEYSALTAAGTLSLSDTARLLRIRGQAMQKAVPVGVGAMAAILGLEFDDVSAIAKEATNSEICSAANDNAFGQVVVSGHVQAVEKAIALATEKGAKRALMLPVSAPFHCPLMQPAADAMAEALSKVEMRVPVVPLVANVTAAAVESPAEILDLLVKQVTGTVRWRESVLYMKEQGVEKLVELGAGKVLAGLTKRIDRELSAMSIGTPADLEEFANSQM